MTTSEIEALSDDALVLELMAEVAGNTRRISTDPASIEEELQAEVLGRMKSAKDIPQPERDKKAAESLMQWLGWRKSRPVGVFAQKSDDDIRKTISALKQPPGRA